MDASERERLITDWIVMHHAAEDSVEYEQHRWADVRLSEIVRDNPSLSLDLVLSILARDTSDRVLANLAAGPMEDLLGQHGDKIIAAVERVAHDNPSFKRLLGGVWQGEMPDRIWERVRAVASAGW